MPEFVEAWGPMALTPTPFSPIVDGEIIAEAPWRALASGAARDIELLVGHTRDEYSLFNPYLGAEVTEEQVSARISQLAPAIRRDAYCIEYPDANAGQRYELLNSDWLFRMPTLHIADAQHSGGGPAWIYELCWSFNRGEGASHSLDLLLVFGTLSADDVRNHVSALPHAAEELRSVSDRMRSDWVRFATSGDPGWPRYRPDTRTTRVYDSESHTGPYPEEASRRIWCAHDFGTLDLPGRSVELRPAGMQTP
ncbi:carboxylesterase family protein [Mycobacterium sp. JS623]|uniref:carboxylesterase family protein n=1 Tax=Mycobacterium sp. JS623 TaxID=212767 RepID=UPI002FFD3B70